MALSPRIAWLAICLPWPVFPQAYLIQTAAGADHLGDNRLAVTAGLRQPEGVAIDPAGNLFIADAADHRVRRVSPSGIIQTIAGTGDPGFSGDGGLASQAQLNSPYGLAADRFGNLFIADLGNRRVRRVSPDGRITTVAGGGAITADPSSEGSAATVLDLRAPRNVAADFDGGFFISDFEANFVYRVTQAGVLQIFAGNGARTGLAPDGASARAAALPAPAGIAVDADGSVLIADTRNGRVRRVTRGVLATVNAAKAGTVLGLAADAFGNLYFAGTAGCLKAVKGGGELFFPGPVRDVAADPRAAFFHFSEAAGQIRRVTAAGAFSLAAGVGRYGFFGDGGQAASAQFNRVPSVALGPSGELYITDQMNQRVRRVSKPDGNVWTLAGSGACDQRTGILAESAALEAGLCAPLGIAAAPTGEVFIADAGNHRIWRVTPAGRIAPVAGSGEAGFAGDGSPAVLAQLNGPTAVLADGYGNLYIADSGNHRIRRVNPAGFIQTIAGSGVRGGFAGDSGPAVFALLNDPRGMALDNQSNLLIADSQNNRIRKLALATGVITTALDGGLAFPRGVAVDPGGNLIVADTGNHRILKTDADGAATNIAGAFRPGFSGDGGPALSALLQYPNAVAVTAAGEIYVADYFNDRVRLLAPTLAPAAITAPALSAVNAASFAEGPIAPGQIVSLFGAGLAAGQRLGPQVDKSGRVASALGGIEVRFDGLPAPLLFVTDNQINVQAPYEIAEQRTTLIEVLGQGIVKASRTAPTAAAAPGLFTMNGGSGPVVAIAADGSLNSAANPADRGSVWTLYATGEGQTDQSSATGQLASPPLGRPVLPVVLTVGGVPAEILYAGAAPGYVGLMQVNFRVPSGFLPSGALPVSLKAGQWASQSRVTLAVR